MLSKNSGYLRTWLLSKRRKGQVKNQGGEKKSARGTLVLQVTGWGAEKKKCGDQKFSKKSAS